MPSQPPETVLALLALPLSEFVENAYLLLLGRQAEPHEITARLVALRTGWGRVRLLENIVSSPEFAARETKLFGDESNRAFVERLYLSYLKRVPDAHGAAHYIGMLDAGKSRDLVRRDIASSSEACARGAFWIELDRLVADERKNMRRFGRWFGSFRRRERCRNVEMEVLRFQSEAVTKHTQGMIEHVANEAYRSVIPDRHDTSVASLRPDLPSSNLPSDARRMLARLRHFQPKIWTPTNPIEGTY